MNEIDFKEMLEKKLAGALNPVFPNSKFIDDLHKRLVSKPDVSVEYPNYLFPILLLSSGLMFGVVLIVVLNNIFKTIAGKNKSEI